MRCNVQVVNAYGLPAQFKGHADAAVVLRRLGALGQHIQSAAKVFNHSQRTGGLLAILCTV